MNKKVLVIIVTYNGERWIQKSIQSVLDSSIDVDILIIDNNSTDNTLQIIKESFDKQVVLLEKDANLGFGAANNIGLKYALKNKTDYVFLLNQDAYVETNTIENLINVSRNNFNYGILSPIHFNGDGSKLDRNFSNYMSYDGNKNFYSDFVKKEVKEVYDVPFVNAAAWLLPRKTLEIVGGFDPIFYHYGEDDNYCQRIRYHNLKIGVVPKVTIYHDREKRSQNSILAFSKQYFKNYEKTINIVYANINKNDSLKGRKHEKNIALKNIIKSLLKFKIKRSIGHFKEYKLLDNIFKKIQKSRSINVVKGVNYLE